MIDSDVKRIIDSKKPSEKQRIIKDFQAIINFYHSFGHLPRFAHSASLSEKMLSIRLKSYKNCKWTREIVKNHDRYKLLEDIIRTR